MCINFYYVSYQNKSLIWLKNNTKVLLLNFVLYSNGYDHPYGPKNTWQVYYVNIYTYALPQMIWLFLKI